MADVSFDEELAAGLLAASPLFDRAAYAAIAHLPAGAEAALHYVTTGWREGLEPLAGVETAFLRPYFVASGFGEPPAVAWLEIASIVAPPPRTREIAAAAAEAVRPCPFFDARYYARRLPKGLDPALHYAAVGERLGWRPSATFNPSFYLDLYPDLAVVLEGSTLLLHYWRHGLQEGRRGAPAADRMVFDPLPDDDRPVVLVVCHEASRTGAPILGWNLIRELSATYRVVSVLMRGGELEPDFRAAAAASTTPLDWPQWTPIEMRYIARRLVERYAPVYAVANSLETQILVPKLVELGVPVVSLVHEFAAYIRPRTKLAGMYDWADKVVFPAKMVADSSYQAVVGLQARTGLHVLAQGPSEVPGQAQAKASSGAGTAKPVSLRTPDRPDAFVVLGAGGVQLRKGVELFVAAAAKARQMRPDLPLRFVWVGHGFNPENDVNYSIYLDEQIKRSDLGDSFAMYDAVEDIDSLYRQADVFLLSSRLDPQPNVGIDAMLLGLPIVCFEGGAGTAEILAADEATRHLVVPHLDAAAAAEAICRFADARDTLGALREDVARVGRAAFDMPSYVAQIDAWGRQAGQAAHLDDVAILCEAQAVDPALLFGPHEEWLGPGAQERAAMRAYRLWNGIEALASGTALGRPVRRACAGFHPTAYAVAHAEACVKGGRDPLAHWIEAGRPAGPWSRTVYAPGTPGDGHGLRLALHGHFHYPELIGDLLRRLHRNMSRVDLFLTTGTEEKAARLTSACRGYPGAWRVDVVPNRGRDVGPFLTGLAQDVTAGGYDVFGHIHAKRSLAVDAALGERWRNFLWENLVGGRFAMLDTAAAAFAGDDGLGLMMAEEANVIGWNANRAIAEGLAARMGITEPLPDFFDFPLGTMFLARPAALLPLFELKLSWDDYPAEPLEGDGTILHAIERLVPFAARHAGFSVAGMRVPMTSW